MNSICQGYFVTVISQNGITSIKHLSLLKKWLEVYQVCTGVGKRLNMVPTCEAQILKGKTNSVHN